jgi:hypothetical protein
MGTTMRALSFTDDVGGYAIVLCLIVLLAWLDPLLTEAWMVWQRRRNR